MKSRILKKVLIYFLLILLLFALLIGLLFFRLGQKSINEASLKMAESRAKNIAASLTSFLYSDPFIDLAPNNDNETESGNVGQDSSQGNKGSNSSRGNKGSDTEQSKGQGKGSLPDTQGESNRPDSQGESNRQNPQEDSNRSDSQGKSNRPNSQVESNRQYQKPQGQGHRFIAWMNTLLSTNIQIVVDTDDKAFPMNIETILKSELPEEEQDMIDKALQGESVSLLKGIIVREDALILAATPLYDADGYITACLLLKENTTVPSVLRAEAQRLFLISIGIAALFVFVLAIFLTHRLLRPLRRIQLVTQELSAGNYNVRTEIFQRDELGDLAKDVDVLALRLEEAKKESAYLDRLRDDFISSMSHELKTPVTVIKSSTEALQQGLIAEETRQSYYDVLYQEISLLERLIQDLTDLNVLRNEKYPLQQEELNVFDVLRDAVRSQRLLAREKDITLEDKIAEETLYFQGDYARIRQMFVIVINNAIKYSVPGSQVRIDFSGSDKVLSIMNWGKELRPESLSRIFEPFYRDKNTKEKGVGLGLSIAKEIADRHGLKIDVSSGAGETIFSFHF
ncbi:MAG: HAMP domain-containing histidine kinase [Clostridiaceae bacterium]|nr:HAMP domain-containing histidine kinase [Clostridiaceae bacterium]